MSEYITRLSFQVFDKTTFKFDPVFCIHLVNALIMNGALFKCEEDDCNAWHLGVITAGPLDEIPEVFSETALAMLEAAEHDNFQ